jgi:hypothetical protein
MTYFFSLASLLLQSFDGSKITVFWGFLNAFFYSFPILTQDLSLKTHSSQFNLLNLDSEGLSLSRIYSLVKNWSFAFVWRKRTFQGLN